MRLIKRNIFALLMVTSLVSCGGSNPTLSMSLSGTTAFADANVTDIVFIFQSQLTNGSGLDQDGDGVADSFVYPTACGASQPANCGFPATPGEIEVGDLPLGFTYEVTVRLRNSAGNTLYDGQSTFQNTENAATVNVVLD